MYRLTQFGTVSLEHYNQMDAIGSGPTPTAYQVLPDGGAVDLFGDQQKHPGTVERTKSIRLKAATDAALKALYYQLLALRGKRDRLYRTSVDGNIEWCYARLMEVSATRDYQLARYHTLQDVELRFVTQEAFWHGDETGGFFDDGGVFDDGGYFDTGTIENLDTSPETFNLVVGSDAGQAPIRSMTITVYADDAPITTITISRTNGESLTFSGTIAADESLIIDTGIMQVLNGGEDAYDDLVLAPDADMASWFTLEPGTNAITVTYTGGGTDAVIEFNYYEAWF